MSHETTRKFFLAVGSAPHKLPLTPIPRLDPPHAKVTGDAGHSESVQNDTRMLQHRGSKLQTLNVSALPGPAALIIVAAGRSVAARRLEQALVAGDHDGQDKCRIKKYKRKRHRDHPWNHLVQTLAC